MPQSSHQQRTRKEKLPRWFIHASNPHNIWDKNHLWNHLREDDVTLQRANQYPNNLRHIYHTSQNIFWRYKTIVNKMWGHKTSKKNHFTILQGCTHLCGTLPHFNHLEQGHILHSVLLVMAIHPARTRDPPGSPSFGLVSWCLPAFLSGLLRRKMEEILCYCILCVQTEYLILSVNLNAATVYD